MLGGGTDAGVCLCSPASNGAAGVHNGGILHRLEWRWGCCELGLRLTPRYRLACNWFPAPGGGLSEWTWPGVSAQGDALDYCCTACPQHTQARWYGIAASAVGPPIMAHRLVARPGDLTAAAVLCALLQLYCVPCYCLCRAPPAPTPRHTVERTHEMENPAQSPPGHTVSTLRPHSCPYTGCLRLMCHHTTMPTLQPSCIACLRLMCHHTTMPTLQPSCTACLRLMCHHTTMPTLQPSCTACLRLMCHHTTMPTLQPLCTACLRLMCHHTTMRGCGGPSHHIRTLQWATHLQSRLA